ncbi:MAG: hypothetical protein WAO93_04865, partial [Orrella sp.]
IVVSVVTKEDFAAWAAERQAKMAGVVNEPAPSETAGALAAQQPLNDGVNKIAPVSAPLKVSDARF